MPPAKKRTVAKKRTDKRPLVDDYVASLSGWKQDVAKELRKLIRASSRELTEEVKWGFPCYTSGGKCICGFMAMKETVNFVLYLGAELTDPGGLIEGTGKSMRHVKLRAANDIDKSKFQKFIQQSLRLVKDKAEGAAERRRRVLARGAWEQE